MAKYSLPEWIAFDKGERLLNRKPDGLGDGIRHSMTSLIALVVSDVDGTLITPDHSLTSRAQIAVEELKRQRIGFTLASSRPPQGLQSLVKALGVELPFAPFNGAVIVSSPDRIIHKQVIPVSLINRVYSLSEQCGLNLWVYQESGWYAERRDKLVDREERTAGFQARVDSNIRRFFEGCPKLTLAGNPEAVGRCHQKVIKELGTQLEATCSKPRFLDITHKEANKGAVITQLSRILKIPTERIAAIGDGPNDVGMFNRAGISIAMGNAKHEVKRAATFVTNPNTEDGFAKGIERYVLGSVNLV